MAVYARSTSFQARAGTIDEGIAEVRDRVMPAAMALEGCVGLSMICDRESGLCVTTSAWTTRKALDQSGQSMLAHLQHGSEIFGSAPSFDLWEIAIVHRHGVSGQGARVRCTWLNLDPAELSHSFETYRLVMLPAFDDMQGFCSAGLMVDPATGRAVSSVTFASQELMVASRPATERLRSRTAEDVGNTVADIEEFELVLAHLHVPETVRPRYS